MNSGRFKAVKEEVAEQVNNFQYAEEANHKFRKTGSKGNNSKANNHLTDIPTTSNCTGPVGKSVGSP